MSDLNPSEILKKKRNRGRQPKTIPQQTKPKFIQKKLKLGKKVKKNTRQNIIKPKPIKKIVEYQNYLTGNINPINKIEKTLPEEENEFKKEDSCQENSLGQLTKNFINYIKTTGKKSININDLVNELQVKKRRIYDITNVLQGIGYLQKSGKNEIIWTKTIINKTKSKKKLANKKNNNNNNINNNKQKINIEQLEQEKDKYEKQINIFKDEFNSIAKKVDFAKYGYITKDDLKTLSINDKVDLLIIKATKGTVMNIVDKNDIKITYEKVKKLMENGEMKTNEVLLNILKKNNQLLFTCPENEGLSLYNVKNGEIQEIGTNMNNNINNNNNRKNISISKFINNNFNINNLIENKNINFAFNYNVNINKDNLIPNNNTINNKINNNLIVLNNNNNNNNNNKEELGNNKYKTNNNNNTSFSKSFFVNYNERGNNETIPHNITVNNEEKNIGVYATPSKTTYNQGHMLNSQISGGINFFNYKNQMKKSNINNNNNANNFVEENFSFTANSSFQKK